MQIVIAGKDPTNLESYLAESGHQVKSFYVNDICLNIAHAYNPDIFIYMEDVVDKVSHEQALKQIQEYRILIIANKENPLIPYAAALGIKDFIFQPCELSAVLARINNPATTNEAAEMLRYVPGIKVDKPNEEVKNNSKEKKRLFNLPQKPEKTKIAPQAQEPISIVYSNHYDVFNDLKKSILIDLGGTVTEKLVDEHPDIWKSDWRLELRSQPIKLPSGSLFYGLTRELGTRDDRDDSIIIDFIYHISSKSSGKKPVYIIDPGEQAEALHRLGIPERS